MGNTKLKVTSKKYGLRSRLKHHNAQYSGHSISTPSGVVASVAIALTIDDRYFTISFGPDIDAATLENIADNFLKLAKTAKINQGGTNG